MLLEQQFKLKYQRNTKMVAHSLSVELLTDVINNKKYDSNYFVGVRLETIGLNM